MKLLLFLIHTFLCRSCFSVDELSSQSSVRRRFSLSLSGCRDSIPVIRLLRRNVVVDVVPPKVDEWRLCSIMDSQSASNDSQIFIDFIVLVFVTGHNRIWPDGSSSTLLNRFRVRLPTRT